MSDSLAKINQSAASQMSSSTGADSEQCRPKPFRGRFDLGPFFFFFLTY